MKYQKFIFDHYIFDPEGKRVELHYGFDDDVHFVETFEFDYEFVSGYDQKALDRALFGLFIMAGVSYYKAALPPEIEIRQGLLSQAQADFFTKSYRLGLGEFAYRNKLSLVNPIFPVSEQVLGNAEPIPNLEGSLVAVGGGKDSLVSIELLRGAGESAATWMVNHSDQIGPLIVKSELPHLAVRREIAPELLRLNLEGALNGHVPITGILMFVGVVSAILAGKANVVFSLEWSAGEGNAEYEGVEVNHQYSKSFEFEQALQEYTKNWISPSVQVFSLLRPFSELKIAELLCQKYLDKYWGTFSSCNSNYHLGDHQVLGWCGHCPKCAFVFLVFAPFLPKERLMKLFEGKNLFVSKELVTTYNEILGLAGHKPFECVGEIHESRQAVVMARASGDYPELERFKFEDPKFDYTVRHPSAMPEKYAKIVDSI